jgi:hypothetical protein
MTVPNTTYRVLVEKLGAQDASAFVGNEGEVFYDPNTPALKLSDGSTPGGVAIGGTGGGSTGNITFSEERIIGASNDEFGLGVIQITPSLNDEGAGTPYVDNGQYVNVYPTVGDDAPHIHITAGTLSTTSNYYDDTNGYYYGDIFLGDDLNYFQVKGNGELYINCSQRSSFINFDIGTYDRNRINFECDSNDLNLYSEGLDFDSDFAIARGRTDYVGAGTSGIIYESQVYEDECGSMKLLVQCQGSDGSCQLSELLIVRPYQGSTVFMNETGRVTGIGTSAHVTFSASYNVGTDRIEIFADTTTDPNNDQWSFRIVPIEVQEYQD